MKKVVDKLEAIIDQQVILLEKINEADYAAKSSPLKWSKKEILGHLVDSAQNNIRRFVVGQYEEMPFVVYNQDKWVIASAYQEWNTADLIRLWYLCNKQICQILRRMPAEKYSNECRTQAVHTLEWLAEDYVKHLLHHTHVILDLEPVSYP